MIVETIGQAMVMILGVCFSVCMLVGTGWFLYMAGIFVSEERVDRLERKQARRRRKRNLGS